MLIFLILTKKKIRIEIAWGFNRTNWLASVCFKQISHLQSLENQVCIQPLKREKRTIRHQWRQSRTRRILLLVQVPSLNLSFVWVHGNIFHKMWPAQCWYIIAFIDGSSILEIVLVLAKLDAYIATALAILRENSKGSVEGHRQKGYKGAFRSHLPKSFQRIVGKVRTFVQIWCSAELELSYLSLFGSSLELTEIARDATVEVFVPTVQRRLIAEFFKWFSWYVMIYSGKVNDCYIAGYNPDSNATVILSSSSDSKTYKVI